MGENGKGKFYYHQQTKDWVGSQLGKDFNIDQLNTNTGQTNVLSVQKPNHDGCNILKLSTDIGNTSNVKGGCRLVWFRTLAFQANDPGFKSRRPHHNPGSKPFYSKLDFIANEAKKCLIRPIRAPNTGFYWKTRTLGAGMITSYEARPPVPKFTFVT